MSEPTSPNQYSAQSVHDGRPYIWAHQVIKNFCLEVCQVLFSGDNYRYVWDPDLEKSQITITDKYAFNLSKVGAQPAIVASRGPIGWARTSGFRQMQSEDLKTGTRVYTRLAQGSCTLSCFSANGLEAEEMAAFLFDGFTSLRDVLRKIGKQGIMVPSYQGFFQVEAVNMGEEALVKSDARPEIHVVPVAIAAMVQRRWSVAPRGARKLQGVNVRTSMGNP
jgi:hypothetical protein